MLFLLRSLKQWFWWGTIISFICQFSSWWPQTSVQWCGLETNGMWETIWSTYHEHGKRKKTGVADRNWTYDLPYIGSDALITELQRTRGELGHVHCTGLGSNLLLCVLSLDKQHSLTMALVTHTLIAQTLDSAIHRINYYPVDNY